MPHPVDPDRISALLKEIAHSYILPRFRQLQTDDISSKTVPDDLVTIADREAEAALDKALTAQFPGAVVIGEESVSEGVKTLSPLDSLEGMVWITDPVDGTWNFVQGHDEFAIMLACVIDGEVRFSWIYDIPGDRMMVAEKGQGAYLSGVRLHTAQHKDLAAREGFLGMKYFPPAMRPALQEGASLVKDAGSLRCAGHEYIRMASGAVDFGLYGRCHPWDHLPGTLAVMEAGGHVARWDRTPYRPQADIVRGLLVTADTDLWDEMDRAFVRGALERYGMTS